MNIFYTGRFKKDFKRMIKRRKREDKLYFVINEIAERRTLPAKYNDHYLSGKWANRKDCHIEPDWILIYYVNNDTLILERTGSHSDLFK